jgi:hypothetical protein
LFFAAGLLFFSCDQYPIFFAISQEVEPVEPKIKGTPTNIVNTIEGSETVLYVASKFNSEVYRYDDSGWSNLPDVDGDILELASDRTYVYALTGDPMSITTVWKYESGRWASVKSREEIQSIYGSDGQVFYGAKGKVFTFTDKESGSSGTLKGAAWDGANYYLAMSGTNGCLYSFNSTTFTPRYTGNVVGVIVVASTIIAITSDGDIIDGNGAVMLRTGFNFSGAIGRWTDGTNNLLLLGIQQGSSSTTHGYREILLNPNGTLSGGPRVPGESSPSSVSNKDKYNSTIGTHIVTSFNQANDGILFASTARNGVWSYREVWNAEE